MPVKTFSLSLTTRGQTDICDLTGELSRLVIKSDMTSGILTVFCPSSTSGITTVEYEDGAISDLKTMFNDLIPSSNHYFHNAKWQDGNGHSHMRAALLGPSMSIPFVKGRLTLGTWQQVVYVDFDVRPRERELVVQVVGE